MIFYDFTDGHHWKNGDLTMKKVLDFIQKNVMLRSAL